jgi:hypothetical protein
MLPAPPLRGSRLDHDLNWTSSESLYTKFHNHLYVLKVTVVALLGG